MRFLYYCRGAGPGGLRRWWSWAWGGWCFVRGLFHDPECASVLEEALSEGSAGLEFGGGSFRRLGYWAFLLVCLDWGCLPYGCYL